MWRQMANTLGMVLFSLVWGVVLVIEPWRSLVVYLLQNGSHLIHTSVGKLQLLREHLSSKHRPTGGDDNDDDNAAEVGKP